MRTLLSQCLPGPWSLATAYPPPLPCPRRATRARACRSWNPSGLVVQFNPTACWGDSWPAAFQSPAAFDRCLGPVGNDRRLARTQHVVDVDRALHTIQEVTVGCAVRASLPTSMYRTAMQTDALPTDSDRLTAACSTRRRSQVQVLYRPFASHPQRTSFLNCANG